MLLTNTLLKNGSRLFNRQFRVFYCTQRNQLLNNCLIKENHLLKTKQQMTKLFIQRCYSNENNQDKQDENKQEQKPVRLPPLVDNQIHLMPNFFVALKSSYYLHGVIGTSLDKEFSMYDFVEATKQATEVVSEYLSQENYEALEGLLSNKAIQDLRHKISRLSPEQKKLIPIDKRDIYGYFPYRIEVVYEGEGENQRKFAEITEVFYILKGLHELQKRDVMPPLTMGLMPEYQEKIYVCNLKFRRDYTDGNDAPWIIEMYNQFTLIAMDT